MSNNYGGVLLADLRVSQWTARKTDKRAAQDVADMNNVEARAGGTYYKSLVACEELDNIKTLVNKARAYHYTLTLPWLDTGARVLPATLFTEYIAQMNDFGTQFTELVDDFVQKYPFFRSEAKRMLGNLFNDEEYPRTDELYARFSFKVNYYPMPVGSDIRCHLGDEELEKRVRAEVDANTKAAINTTVIDVVERIRDVLESYLRATCKDTGITKAFMANAKSLVSVLPALNITNDNRITALYETLKNELTRYSVDEIKTDAETRREAFEAAMKAKGDLAAWFGK